MDFLELSSILSISTILQKQKNSFAKVRGENLAAA